MLRYAFAIFALAGGQVRAEEYTCLTPGLADGPMYILTSDEQKQKFIELSSHSIIEGVSEEVVNIYSNVFNTSDQWPLGKIVAYKKLSPTYVFDFLEHDQKSRRILGDLIILKSSGSPLYYKLTCDLTSKPKPFDFTPKE